MKLTLRLAPHEGAAAETRTLEDGTLTLGRGSEQDWVLGDPERTISKLHCRVDSSGEGFLLTDLSTNGVFVNDDPAPLGRGHAHALADGDRIALGPYTLLVGIGPGAPPPGLDAGSWAEPEGGLVRPAPAPLAAAYDGVPQTHGSPLPRADEPWLDAIPGGDFGPGLRAAPLGWDAPPDPAAYAATGARPDGLPPLIPPTEFAQQSEHLSAISTLMHTPAPAAVLPSDWNDADPMDGVELAPSRLAEDILAPAAPAPVPEQDIDALLAPLAAQATPTASPLEAPTPTALPLEAPTPTASPLEAPTPTASPLAAQATTASPLPMPGRAAATPQSPAGRAEDLVAGFLEASGLGLESLAGASAREAGRNLGHLVRFAVEGVRDVLATRAMVKAELRVDQTIVQARDNNALKFAPDVQRCLDAMVGAPPPAFMPGAAAMRQSLDDIKRHELALIAALNSVFTEISAQLDPEAIRTQARAENSFGAALPMMREAACWALYEKRYAALQQAGGAENTGGSLLSPLAAAYGRQVRGPSQPPATTPHEVPAP